MERFGYTKIIRDGNIDNLIKDCNEIRFILPIRNPMDCAVSNLKTGRLRNFKDLNHSIGGDGKEIILSSLFSRYEWFLSLEEKYPDRFLHFFEDEINKETLIKIQDFLNIPYDNQWISDVMLTWKIRKGIYDHSDKFKKLYKELINKHIDNESTSNKFKNLII